MLEFDSTRKAVLQKVFLRRKGNGYNIKTGGYGKCVRKNQAVFGKSAREHLTHLDVLNPANVTI